MAYYGTLTWQHRIEGVVAAWADRHPLEVEHVKKAAKQLMEIRGQDHGHCRDGYLKGGLTESLNRMMIHEFGVNWRQDRTIYNTFWRVFAIGRFNTYERKF